MCPGNSHMDNRVPRIVSRTMPTAAHGKKKQACPALAEEMRDKRYGSISVPSDTEYEFWTWFYFPPVSKSDYNFTFLVLILFSDLQEKK